MEKVAEIFCDMVQIDSESGEEERFLSYLKELFTRELQAECVRDSYGNLIARVPAKGSDKTEPILLGAHADTVKPGKGIEPVIENGVIRSKGDTILGADDKAGIAEIFEAVRTAERHPPVEIVITREEEIGLFGSKNLDTSLVDAKMGFIVDSDVLDTVIIGGPTHISLDIEIVGKAAHAGMEPEKGISAIRVAAEAITRFPEGRIDAETTANVGTIHGGLIRNGVPDRVTIQAECRSLNDEKAQRQAERMRRAFEDTAAAAGAKANIDVILEYSAFQLSEDEPVVAIAKQAIAAVGLEPKAQVITGGTDALVLCGKGITSVVLGDGGRAEHTLEENIVIADMVKATAIIRTLLENLA
jgi:tripeptide aminopeptidase